MRTVTDAGSPPASRQWKPGERALATAKGVVKEVDIAIHITRYTIVKAEQGKRPSDSEWLRWILADEEQAQKQLRKEQADKTKQRRWYDVAD